VGSEDNSTIRGFKLYIKIFCKRSRTETSSKGQRGKMLQIRISLKFTRFLGNVFDSCTDFPTL
jgi:hypothetical protein